MLHYIWHVNLVFSGSCRTKHTNIKNDKADNLARMFGDKNRPNSSFPLFSVLMCLSSEHPYPPRSSVLDWIKKVEYQIVFLISTPFEFDLNVQLHNQIFWASLVYLSSSFYHQECPINATNVANHPINWANK